MSAVDSYGKFCDEQCVLPNRLLHLAFINFSLQDQTWDLHGCTFIGDEDLGPLLSMLTLNTELVGLNLSNMGIGNSVCRGLFATLAQCEKLELLDLSHNFITADVVPMLKKMCKAHPKLVLANVNLEGTYAKFEQSSRKRVANFVKPPPFQDEDVIGKPWDFPEYEREDKFTRNNRPAPRQPFRAEQPETKQPVTQEDPVALALVPGASKSRASSSLSQREASSSHTSSGESASGTTPALSARGPTPVRNVRIRSIAARKSLSAEQMAPLPPTLSAYSFSSKGSVLPEHEVLFRSVKHHKFSSAQLKGAVTYRPRPPQPQAIASPFNYSTLSTPRVLKRDEQHAFDHARHLHTYDCHLEHRRPDLNHEIRAKSLAGRPILPPPSLIFDQEESGMEERNLTRHQLQLRYLANQGAALNEKLRRLTESNGMSRGDDLDINGPSATAYAFKMLAQSNTQPPQITNQSTEIPAHNRPASASSYHSVSSMPLFRRLHMRRPRRYVVSEHQRISFNGPAACMTNNVPEHISGGSQLQS